IGVRIPGERRPHLGLAHGVEGPIKVMAWSKVCFLPRHIAYPWDRTRNVNDDGRISSPREVQPTWWFRIETTYGERLQALLLKMSSVGEVTK
ncbi:MAG: hypothetical protein ACREXR_24245, partial [Gammaproteobacteria bacterium]